MRLGFSRRLAKPIFALALPIMLQGLLLNLMGFVDALMIGQLGEIAISALGNSQQLLSFLFLLMAAFSIGGGVLIAQDKGAGKQKNIQQHALAMLQAAVLAGLGFGLLLWCFSNELIGVLTTDIFKAADARSAVPQAAKAYLNIVAFALPAMVTSQLLTAVMNSLGDTKTPVMLGVIFNMINFVLNYLLIFGGGFSPLWDPLWAPMGLAGAATATLCASTGQALCLAYLCHRSDNGINLSIRGLFKYYPHSHRRIIQLGYPNTIDGFYWQGARVFYTVLINAISATAYAAYIIVRTLKSLFMLPISGLQTATAVHIGHLLGAKRFRQAKLSAITAIWVGLALMAIPALLLLMFAEPLLHLYKVELSTQTLALNCCYILALSLFFTAINAVIPGLLRAGGDTAAVMHITLLSFILCGAPLSYLFGIYWEWGLLGAFIGISLEEVFKASLFILRMHQYRWMKTLS